MTCKPWTFGILAALTLPLSAYSLKINELIIAAPISDAQRDATVKAARAFATSGTPERDLAPAEPSQKLS
jgi:hypothetical protein